MGFISVHIICFVVISFDFFVLKKIKFTLKVKIARIKLTKVISQAHKLKDFSLTTQTSSSCFIFSQIIRLADTMTVGLKLVFHSKLAWFLVLQMIHLRETLLAAIAKPQRNFRTLMLQCGAEMGKFYNIIQLVCVT